MYNLNKSNLDGFLYAGSQLVDVESNSLEYVTKNNQLHILQNMETGEMERFTTSELCQMYAKEPRPAWYWCEFTHGKNTVNCNPWQIVPYENYKDAWETITGAMEWLEWDEMEEEEKKSIFIKLWRFDHVLIGIFNAEEIEEISYGSYEPWKEL